MKQTLQSLLPDNISDEAAYQLIEFFVEVAYLVEQQYFARAKRHIDRITEKPEDRYRSDNTLAIDEI